MEISITRALAELKLLDARILKTINNATFVACNKKSAKNVNGRINKEDFNIMVKSDFQSITDLIERKKFIKSAVVESNAKTIVIINKKEMTVADAIERKINIEHEKYLLDAMKTQLRRAVAAMETHNQGVDLKLNNLLETMVGSDNAKNIDKESNEFAVSYRNDNEYEILDPLGIDLEIKRLEEEIENFESEVDYILSESNTITKIVIPD